MDLPSHASAMERAEREQSTPKETFDDSISGPAKWFAVVVLGLIALGAVVWSALIRPQTVVFVERRGAGETGLAAAASGDEDSTRKAQASPARSASNTVGPATTKKTTSKAGALMGTVNINTASEAELQLLPGIGPALAQRIIADRQKNGVYTSVEQLDRVSGIGGKKLEQLRPHVRVSDEEPSVTGPGAGGGEGDQPPAKP
ncbi:MAG: helix-hairpin-helix domain-containing protein [Phycisphaerales bacterium]|nr:helix-hairpin-helix domain-containing protein [Phycisphaerales bacterium]